MYKTISIVLSSVAILLFSPDSLSVSKAYATTDYVTVKEPVLQLDTVYGYPMKVTPYAWVRISVPKAFSKKVEFYQFGDTTFLGPRGWRAKSKAVIGQDGLIEASIFNPRQPQEQMTIEGSGGCWGCAMDSASPFWPAIAKNNIGWTGKTAKESGYLVRNDGAHGKDFEMVTSFGYLIQGVLYANLASHKHYATFEQLIVLPKSLSAFSNYLSRYFSDNLIPFPVAADYSQFF